MERPRRAVRTLMALSTQSCPDNVFRDTENWGRSGNAPYFANLEFEQPDRECIPLARTSDYRGLFMHPISDVAANT